MSAKFDQAFKIVVDHEGGYDLTSADPGNWTGGRVGAGALRGTKYGISAAAFPDLVIATLTLDQARAIYASRYWDAVDADALPPPLALLVFDASVNCGPSRAITWLQASAGAEADGILGPRTAQAVQRAVAAGIDTFCGQYLAERLAFMAALPTWRIFGLGWSRRLCALAYQSLSYMDGAS